MKKLFVAILFALMIVPARSQTVEKVVQFYGETVESSYAGVQPYSANIKVKFLSNGDIDVGGTRYERYYNTYAHGVQVSFNGCTTYKSTWTLGGYDATYLIVRNDHKAANKIFFSVNTMTWNLEWNSTFRYVAKENNKSLGL